MAPAPRLREFEIWVVSGIVGLGFPRLTDQSLAVAKKKTKKTRRAQDGFH
jgi:hypothetical protein